MDAVLRATAVYLVLLLLFRFSGRRVLAQVTMFDFILLLIVAEATQQALLGQNFSVTYAALVITTLLLLDLVSNYLSYRFDRFKRITESLPMVIVDHGQPLENVLAKYRMSSQDVVDAARQEYGLERLDQVKWAVLEPSGGVSIVPYDNSAGPQPRE
jgi:uncharacterized membrane protein YcaP (DUF421 family)